MHLIPPSVYLKDTGTVKGRGVFAARPIKSGETVEIALVIVLRIPFPMLPQDVQRMVFNWELLANVQGTHALALGYGSMYNHDNPANLRYQADPTTDSLHFIAVRDIAADEELTVNYNATGGAAEWHDDNWFQRMKITPIVGSGGTPPTGQ